MNKNNPIDIDRFCNRMAKRLRESRTTDEKAKSLMTYAAKLIDELKQIAKENYTYKLKITPLLLKYYLGQDDKLKNRLDEVFPNFYVSHKLNDFLVEKGIETSPDEIIKEIDNILEEQKILKEIIE